MAGTLRLHTLLTHARTAGAQIRLIGDPHQLGAVESGGAFRLIVHDVGAIELTDLHRFTDPAEAAATLLLRDGNPAAINHYQNRGRLHGGTRDHMLDAAYTAWHRDLTAGLDTLLIASSGEEVTALNQRARLDRLAAGQFSALGAELHDGTIGGVGDWVVTRRNQRLSTTGNGRDFVKNGDRWTVTAVHPDGTVTLTGRARGTVRVPAEYAARDLDLGYAATVHRAQGVTVDTAHVLVADADSRETVYVAASRARQRTDLYLAVEDERLEITAPPTLPVEMLQRVLSTSASATSSIEAIRTFQQSRTPTSRRALSTEMTATAPSPEPV